MENEISYKIIGAAIEVHQILGGPGFIRKRIRKLIVSVKYKNAVPLLGSRCAWQNKVIIEVKATKEELLFTKHNS